MKMRTWINSLAFLNITRGKRGSTSFTPCYVDRPSRGDLTRAGRLTGAASALIDHASACTSWDWLDSGDAWRHDRPTGAALALAEVGGYALAWVGALCAGHVAMEYGDGDDFACEDQCTIV